MRYSRDFTITQREVSALYQMLALRRWSKGILGFAVAGALVAKLYLNWLAIALNTAGTVLVLIAAAILTALLITLGILIRTRFQVRDSMRKTGRGNYVQQTRIDGFGVHVTVDQTSSKAGFEKLKLVQETSSAFYLFLTGSDAWILPKAQMENAEEECRTLREIFSKVVPSRQLKLKK